MSHDNRHDDARKMIIDEMIGEPLRQLHIQAGRPSARTVAALTTRRVSAGTVENALKSKSLVGQSNLIEIVTALKGDTEDFRLRWNKAYERLEALKHPHTFVNSTAISSEIPPPLAADDTTPRTDTPAVKVHGWRDKWRRNIRRRLIRGAATILSLLGAMAIWITNDLPPFDSDHTPAVAVKQVDGAPVYIQCSTRARSILNQPGTTRGGVLVGALKPNDRFVVTAKTDYWRRGYVLENPTLQGWVMSTYLCPAGPQG